MPRQDRLMRLIEMLRAPGPHRAADLAARLGVSARTLYRDMAALAEAGVPVEGTPGTGYRLAGLPSLPPLRLTEAEIEALGLAVAIVAEAPDPELRDAARSLAAKIDAALPLEAPPEAAAWAAALAPLADPARGLSHVATLRAAIRGRQKLALGYPDETGAERRRTVRPLRLSGAGGLWTLLAWCEDSGTFGQFRLDLITAAAALPELFVDEPGRRLSDYRA